MRVEQANLIIEFDNGTVIKLGLQDQLTQRTNNELVLTKCPADHHQKIHSKPKFLVTGDSYLSATLSPNNLDI